MEIVSNNFNVDSNGNMTCKGARVDGNINITGARDDDNSRFYIKNDNGGVNITPAGIRVYRGNKSCLIDLSETANVNIILTNDINNNPPSSYTTLSSVGIRTPEVTQTSLERIKKNISIYNENALKTILNSDIYSYNLKSEKDSDNKHIGFVIGDKYRTPKEIINNEGNAIELYSAIGMLWKGMQEQQKIIEELQNKIKEMEEKIDGKN